MTPEAIVIGAGPAGMTAAAILAEAGVATLVLDENPAAGGQIWRGIEAAPATRRTLLGEDYAAGLAVARRLAASGADHRPGTTVWQLSSEREVGWTDGSRARLTTVPVVIVATGAQERPMPVPGWTLPGVMTAGGAQTLLKNAGIAADGAVFAGTGPLLYLVVRQYLAAGIRVAAVLDTTDRRQRSRALREMPAALTRPGPLLKGLAWMREITRAGVPRVRGVTALKVLGEEAATGIAWRAGHGDWQEIATEHVFLHQGVVPSVNLSMAAGLDHQWCDRQLCWRPETDAWGESTAEGIFVAGDGAGIAGWSAALARGEIAALGALTRLGRLGESDRDARAAAPRRALAAEERLRPFLDTWFRPADAFRLPPDDTIVCRCEEITAGALREAIGIGLAGPNQLKSYSRAGMGPCQGRSCGLTVHEMMAASTGRRPSELEPLRLRPPVKPLTITELADLETDDAG
ncbi:MAG: NAD(P)/FAD-dependent oxidoreductase [Pseudomonadota bacterium]